MNPKHSRLAGPAAAFIALSGLNVGCQVKPTPPGVQPPAAIGTVTVDPFFKIQERNAEASDFVLYEHEFQGNSARLTDAGETHLKQIALRMPRVPFGVNVAPTRISTRPGDTYGFPVHGNEELDMQRREVVVQALQGFGIKDAEQRVTVSPALTFPYTDVEAERDYSRAINQLGPGGSGAGGGSGGGFF